MSFYHGCIRALDVVEPYHPDRVLRQFGYVQTIPSNPIVPSRAIRGAKPGQYRLLWGTLGSMFATWDNHILSVSRRGQKADPSWECDTSYMNWFMSVSHPKVRNPDLGPTSSAPSFSVDSGRPWERIRNACNLLEPLVDVWRNRDSHVSVDYFMPRVEDAVKALHGLTLSDAHQEDPPMERPRGQTRSRSTRRAASGSSRDL